MSCRMKKERLEMPTLQFSDGMTINTEGPYRMISEYDGLYVVGHGFLCAVDSIEDGQDMLRKLKPNEDKDA